MTSKDNVDIELRQNSKLLNNKLNSAKIIFDKITNNKTVEHFFPSRNDNKFDEVNYFVKGLVNPNNSNSSKTKYVNNTPRKPIYPRLLPKIDSHKSRDLHRNLSAKIINDSKSYVK